MKHKGNLSEEVAINFGIQISEIIGYLHGRKPIPILHLDLKPQNVIISDGRVYLVDFGNSMFLNSKRMYMSGTKGFAAPEQYIFDGIDVATDVYGLGALLYFMVTGQSFLCVENLMSDTKFCVSENFKQIIIQCTSAKDSRIRDAFLVADSLSKIIQERIRKNIVNKEDEDLMGKPLMVSVIGAEKHIGATHFALALAGRLNETGVRTIYEDAGGNVIKAIYEKAERCTLNSGIYYYSNIMMKYSYTQFISLKNEVHCRIVDCDKFENVKDIIMNSNAVVIIAGKKDWEIDNSKEMLRKVKEIRGNSKVVLLWNFISDDKNCVPIFFNPMKRDEDTNSFLDKVINVIVEEDNVYQEKRKKRLFSFFTGKNRS